MYPATELQEKIARLTANLGKLPVRDHEFANSLLGKAKLGYMLTEKQRHWVGVLADRASGVAEPAKPAQAGNDGFQAIHALLHAAAEKLKRPIVRVALTRDERQPDGTVKPVVIARVRLTIAGPTSKYAGNINITDAGASEDGQREWYGSINAEGRLYLARNVEALQEPLRAALKAVAANPAGAAKLYGQLTSACCFCGTGLTDGASIAVGYGPICAGKYGLPHGEDHGVKGGYREQAWEKARIADRIDGYDRDDLNDSLPF